MAGKPNPGSELISFVITLSKLRGPIGLLSDRRLVLAVNRTGDSRQRGDRRLQKSSTWMPT